MFDTRGVAQGGVVRSNGKFSVYLVHVSVPQLMLCSFHIHTTTCDIVLPKINQP